jgi:hypothetical protein
MLRKVLLDHPNALNGYVAKMTRSPPHDRPQIRDLLKNKKNVHPYDRWVRL